MTVYPDDLFVMLVILALTAFSLVLGSVTLVDREPPEDEAHPAE